MNILKICGHKDNIGGIVNLQQSLRKYNVYSQHNYYYFRSGRINNNFLHSFKIVLILDYFFNYFLFINKILKNNFSVIEINSSLKYISILRDLVFILLIKLFSKNSRILFFIHGWDESFLSSKLLNNFTKKILRNNVSKFLVLAKSFKKSLILNLEISSANIDVIKTSVDVKKYISDNIKKTNKLNILFMSRFVEEKGVLEYIKACNELSHRNDLVFNLAGDGPLKDYLLNYIKKNNIKVNNFGYLRDSMKVSALQKNDIFVFPSYYGEGCPVSVLEGMAAKNALIYTDVGGLSDFLTNSINGIMVKKKNVNSIVDAIKNLSSNVEYLNKIKSNNFELSKEFDTKKLHSKLEKIYNSVNV